jgi:hypothetical protein
MNDFTARIDYSLDGPASDTVSSSDAPDVQAILALDVASFELRCMKGDCPSGDYVPG